jgi:adenylate cyclase
LAAYFPTQVAELLARSHKVGLIRWSKDVAVIDCDLVGFTTIAEKSTPECVAEFLKAYRGVVEDAVFGAEGAIVSFTGDGVTAVFGLTDAARPAAMAALDCAQNVEANWRETGRRILGEDFPSAVLGIDFGSVRSGLVGEGHSLSLLILGEPVTGAAALQAMTRELSASILISDSGKQAAVAADPDIAARLTPVANSGPTIWTLQHGNRETARQN